MTTQTIENEEEASTGLGFYTVLAAGILVAPAVMLMLLQLPVHYILISTTETVIQMLAHVALMGVYSVLAAITTLTYLLMLFSKNDRAILSGWMKFFLPGQTKAPSDPKRKIGAIRASWNYLMLLLSLVLCGLPIISFFIFLYRVAAGY